MLHPVGPQPPSVYWRRRLVALASTLALLILLGLTARAVIGRSAATPVADTSSSHRTTPPASTTPTSSAVSSSLAATSNAAPSSPSAAAATTSPTAASPSTSAHSTAAPLPCTPGQLQVQAVVGQPQYAIGAQPVLTLQVTNEGALPCTQDVADSQIELRVYNGASRVWGSHDCQIQPGVDVRTLLTGHPAGFSIVWSGLSSQPQCAGTRQRVGAGTYTLYAALSGHDGTAAQFTIS